MLDWLAEPLLVPERAHSPLHSHAASLCRVHAPLKCQRMLQYWEKLECLELLQQNFGVHVETQRIMEYLSRGRSSEAHPNINRMSILKHREREDKREKSSWLKFWFNFAQQLACYRMMLERLVSSSKRDHNMLVLLHLKLIFYMPLIIHAGNVNWQSFHPR